MIHAAIMGSIERFMSVLIEHVAGNFPVWLSPTQVAIVPVLEQHQDYCVKLNQQLQEAGIRTILDVKDDSLGKRIRAHKGMLVPYVVVVGDKEVESKTLTIECREGVRLEGLTSMDFLTRVTKEIDERAIN